MRLGSFYRFGLLLGLLFCLSGAIRPGLADTIKIGVIDSDRLLQETEVGKKARAKFSAEMQATKDFITKKQKRLKVLRESLLLSQQVEDEPEVIKEKQQELAKEAQEYKQISQLLKKRLRRKDVAIAEELRQKVQQIIDEYMDEHDYCLILEKQDTIAICDTVDITDAIIKILNKRTFPSDKKED